MQLAAQWAQSGRTAHRAPAIPAVPRESLSWCFCFLEVSCNEHKYCDLLEFAAMIRTKLNMSLRLILLTVPWAYVVNVIGYSKGKGKKKRKPAPLCLTHPVFPSSSHLCWQLPPGATGAAGEGWLCSLQGALPAQGCSGAGTCPRAQLCAGSRLLMAALCSHGSVFYWAGLCLYLSWSVFLQFWYWWQLVRQPS